VRYRFRGIIRESGKPVEGHVEADNPDIAFNMLGENGIIADSLREDPRPLNLSQRTGENAPIADALESALDTSATQVPFEQIESRFKGKSVWVIDREKIKRRVAQVVDGALAQAMQGDAGGAETREAVAQAIEGLFKDSRNLTSQVSTTTVTLEQQLNRMAQFISKGEALLAAITAAVRSGGFGGGGGAPRRYALEKKSLGQEQNTVLLEIFKSNVELRQSLMPGYVPPSPKPKNDNAPASAPSPAPSTSETNVTPEPKQETAP
jgi:hypothetical protein